MRRRLLWLLVAPIAVAASQCAHWLAYRLAVPDADARSQLLAATGHGYLGLAPLLGGLATALVLAALALHAAAAARSPSLPPAVARWPFALVPPLCFAVQEHVERLAHDGAVPLQAWADRSFLAGLALQVPFGVAAYLLARLLLRVAALAGRTIASPPPAAATTAFATTRTAMRPSLPRQAPASLDRAGRAPPVLPAV